MQVTLSADAERTYRRAGIAAPAPLARLVALAWCALACNRPDVPKPRLEAAPQSSSALTNTVTIHQPARLGRLELGAQAPRQAAPRQADAHAAGSSPGAGQPRNTAVRCETCHALRPTAVLPASMRELDQFHQGLELLHGSLSCASCHTPSAPITLHLADGQPLPRGGALQLCRQCHGTQYRDYTHGAHGGMSGHWDLSRGARVRNHCVDCHDPHSPQIRQVLPAAPPRDRFFGGQTAASFATGGQH